jgi:hypothetical protein
MPITEVFQKCAGGCGEERELSGHELFLWNLHGPFKWWCQPCVERVEAEAAVKPLLDAIEKYPHLRTKLREILENQ